MPKNPKSQKYNSGDHDYTFIKIPTIEEWVISAPKRARRPFQKKKNEVKHCPFEPGTEENDKEFFRIGGEYPDRNWLVRVIPNKFPFTPHHELVIHTPEHHTHTHNLPVEHIKLIIEAYANRYNAHKDQGTVVIFRNTGHDAGESIGHAHSQIAVVPHDIPIFIPKLERNLEYHGEYLEVGDFVIVCPPYSQWPDEVWVIPKDRNRVFGEILYKEIESLAFVMKRLLKILSIRHGHEFPNNYYIYPYKDWYLRIIPRAKILGGFEIATGIFVNTQNPRETMHFVKELFYEEDEKKIMKYRAQYRKGV